MLFVGDDWAEGHHDIEIVDDDGKRLARRRLPEGLRHGFLCPEPAHCRPDRITAGQGLFPENLGSGSLTGVRFDHRADHREA